MLRTAPSGGLGRHAMLMGGHIESPNPFISVFKGPKVLFATYKNAWNGFNINEVTAVVSSSSSRGVEMRSRRHNKFVADRKKNNNSPSICNEKKKMFVTGLITNNNPPLQWKFGFFFRDCIWQIYWTWNDFFFFATALKKRSRFLPKPMLLIFLLD